MTAMAVVAEADEVVEVVVAVVVVVVVVAAATTTLRAVNQGGENAVASVCGGAAVVVRIIQDTNVVLHEFPGVETTVFSIVQSIRPHARHARANAHLEVLFVDVVDGPLQHDRGSAGVLDSDLDEEHVHPRRFGRENTTGD